ncbi:MAG: tetratricopeptide repeat protein [Gemmatimonadaceae bacterium]
MPTAARRDSARQLTTLAHEAAITGDQRAARDLFQRAGRLDPTDENVAYNLARAYETLRDTAAAVREYCRYLGVSSVGADAADVASRIDRLAPVRPRVIPETAAQQFRSGVAQLEQRRYREAERAFSAALSQVPDWELALYNRGVAFASERQPGPAIRDFEKYLELVPEAPDRPVIVRRVAELRRLTLQPNGALVRGLAVPGLGQLYTRRPVLGAVAFAATAGAVAFAVRTRVVTKTATAVDLLGNPYEYTYPERERPYVAAGVGVAAGVMLASAFEAYLYAKREGGVSRGGAARRADSGLGAFVAPAVPGGHRVAIGVSRRFGRP